MAPPKHVSVVLGCLNGGEFVDRSVPELARFLSSLRKSYEIIVVEDGSSDGSAERLQRLAARMPELRVLSNGRNRGKGYSVRRGVLASEGEFILYTDIDLVYALDDLETVIRELQAGHPVVIANRHLPGSRCLADEAVARFVSRRNRFSLLFNIAIRMLFGLRNRDTQAGLKGFRREIALELFARTRTDRFLLDIELLIMAQKADIPVKEIPVCVTYSTTDSTVRPVRQSLRLARELAKIKRLEMFGAYNPEKQSN